MTKNEKQNIVFKVIKFITSRNEFSSYLKCCMRITEKHAKSPER